MRVFGWFMDMFDDIVADARDARLEARVRRLERTVEALVDALGVELPGAPAHPREPEIDEALARGETVLAIKLVREITGASLKDAKRAVDRGAWRELVRER